MRVGWAKLLNKQPDLMAPLMENGLAGQLKLITMGSLEHSYPRITLNFFPKHFIMLERTKCK